MDYYAIVNPEIIVCSEEFGVSAKIVSVSGYMYFGDVVSYYKIGDLIRFVEHPEAPSKGVSLIERLNEVCLFAFQTNSISEANAIANYNLSDINHGEDDTYLLIKFTDSYIEDLIAEGKADEDDED